jgi:hypothetical protein
MRKERALPSPKQRPYTCSEYTQLRAGGPPPLASAAVFLLFNKNNKKRAILLSLQRGKRRFDISFVERRMELLAAHIAADCALPEEEQAVPPRKACTPADKKKTPLKLSAQPSLPHQRQRTHNTKTKEEKETISEP